MAGYRGKVNRHLDLRGKTYWFKKAIPVDCREHFDGKSAYLESTGTGDIVTARERRDQIDRHLSDLIKNIRKGGVVGDAVRAAAQLAELSREAYRNSSDSSERELIIHALQTHNDTLKGASLTASRNAWLGKEPVDKHVTAWLGEAKLSDKTTKEWASLVRRFAAWAEGKGYKITDINRRKAGEYVSAVLSVMHRTTAKKHLSAVRGYWDYLIRRGYAAQTEATATPWSDQLQPERAKQGSKEDLKRERPFTDDELKTVLHGTVDMEHAEQLRELGLISVLSGMRLSEITDLTVMACKDGVFDLSKAKTVAGLRVVPIHSALHDLITRRSEGKGANDFLFHEFGAMKAASDTLSKAFTRFRNKLGVDDTQEGRRRSLVNFHSFRRTFITKARHAGFPESTIADIVGHDTGQKKTMTFGVYTHGASTEQKRECVEGVTLPT